MNGAEIVYSYLPNGQVMSFTMERNHERPVATVQNNMETEFTLMCDLKGRILYAEDQNMVGRSFYDEIHPVCRNGVEMHMSKVLQTGQGEETCIGVRNHQGMGWRWVQTTAFPFFDDFRATWNIVWTNSAEKKLQLINIVPQEGLHGIIEEASKAVYPA